MTTHKKSVQPEWATAETATATSSTATAILPIPDELEDAPADREQQLVIRPFPDDELQ